MVTGVSVRLNANFATTAPVIGSTIEYSGFAPFAEPSWQLVHFVLKMGWMALFQAMPIRRSGAVVGDDSSASVDMRRLRATRPIAFVGPIAAACVIPGLMTVVSARFSW